MGQRLAELCHADTHGYHEPLFEPPPWLAPRAERRLTVRAAAGFADGVLLAEYRDNAVTLAMAGPLTSVVTVGPAVAASFDLLAGPCPADVDPDSLAACLRDACDVLRARPGVLPFEAALRTPAADCILLRGVLLPQVDGTAAAVLSWKQVLDADATSRLRAELTRSLQQGSGVAPGTTNVFGP